MSAIPQEISGTPLSSEQARYLEGFFAGIRNRGLAFGDVAPAPATGPTTKAERLTPEEVIKREKHPFDALSDLRTKARTGESPAKEDIFRFKWNGLFWLAPVHEGYMCRLRLPGGKITAARFRELASIADDLASGYLQLTTRSNVQVRVIQPRDTLTLLHRLEACGLKARGSGADNLRNFTASPTAGFDPHELIDVMPYIDELAHLVVNTQVFYDLPRKFNIAFDGGGLVAVAEDTNDIGMRAVRLDDGEIYFRILLGGVTGHQEFAEDSGFLCRPEEAVEVCTALVRVWMKHGRRDNRNRARLVYLVKEWGYAKYMEEARKLLGFPLIPLDPSRILPHAKPSVPHPHVGIHPQKQENLHCLGVHVPVGLLQTDEARVLARIAETCGSGELRLTIYQNAMIPDIPAGRLDEAKALLAEAGLRWETSLVRGGAAACTGNRHCKYAGSDTKTHTMELVEWLEERIVLDTPINIHTTGCPHSCAQHYIGDIGLLACKVPGNAEGETREGYHVFVGGGFGEDRKQLGRQLLKGVPAGPELYGKIESLLRAYLRERKHGETFQQFSSSREIETLAAYLAA